MSGFDLHENGVVDILEMLVLALAHGDDLLVLAGPASHIQVQRNVEGWV